MVQENGIAFYRQVTDREDLSIVWHLKERGIPYRMTKETIVEKIKKEGIDSLRKLRDFLISNKYEGIVLAPPDKVMPLPPNAKEMLKHVPRKLIEDEQRELNEFHEGLSIEKDYWFLYLINTFNYYTVYVPKKHIPETVRKIKGIGIEEMITPEAREVLKSKSLKSKIIQTLKRR